MLSDRDIATELFSKPDGTKLIEPLPEYGGTKWADLPHGDPRWASLDSPVQSSSVDLRVGYIYVPGRKSGELGSETRPESSHSVGPGESVIVSTYERVTLPASLGGIVFPPSSLSSQGVLVANIGHIDPGFSGHLRFTIINMGGKPIPLVRGTDRVGTLLLLPLSSSSATPWSSRGDGKPKGEPTRAEVEALAKDFGNMDVRIRDVTERTVNKMKRDYNLWSFIWPLVLSILLGVLAIYFGTGQYVGSRVDTTSVAIADLKDKFAEAKTESVRQQAAVSAEVAKLQAALEDARQRVAALEGRDKAPRGSR